MISSCAGQDALGLPTESIVVGDQALLVAVADNSLERASGLMEVEDLGDLDGMLFVFDSEGPVSFFMLNTPLPLDIWWFDGDATLVGTAEMEPCPFEPCSRYRSAGPVMWALETPLGEFDFEMGSVLSTVENG